MEPTRKDIGIVCPSKLSPPERFLCCALADDPSWQDRELVSLWSAAGDESAWACATTNRAESVAALALLRVLGAAAISPRWSASIGAVESRLSLFMTQLDRVANEMDRKGINLVALKNTGIARGIFPRLAGCPMGDVDTLVQPTDFRRAHEIMTALGFLIDSRGPFDANSLDEAEKQGGAEYTCTLSDGSTLWFELQFRAVAGRWIQPGQEPAAADLIARSSRIAGSAVRLLAPEDNLMQVCLHTAKHSFVRAPGFRLHTDVDRIVRRCGVDWDLFAQQAERLGVCTAAYLSLVIPANLLRTPVPKETLRRLNKTPRKNHCMLAWISRAGLFDPDKRKWSKPGYILFNLMLYDSWAGVWRASFPDRKWMEKQYGARSVPSLVSAYLVRLANLLCKRAKT